MQNNNNNSATTISFRVKCNYHIKATSVRVIAEDGTMMGVFPLVEAIKMAQNDGKDLIEINGKTIPPLCKIQELGKFKFLQKKSIAESKKKQVQQETKELSFKPNTDSNDIAHLVERAKGFLIDGNKVKLVVKFRGRELSHSEIGRDKLNQMALELKDISTSTTPFLEGKAMSILLSPVKVK